MLKNFFRTLCLLLFLAQITEAQDLGNSPYSQVGIGDLSFPSMAHQQAMPGGQVSFTMPFLINHYNPALLARFSKTKSTIFEAGAKTQWKILEQNDKQQRDFGGGLDYLTLAFPVSNRLGAAFGLSTYSMANFDITSIEPVAGSDFLYDRTFKRQGGLNNLFLAIGYDFAKGFRSDSLKNRFSIGIKTSYIFGSVINQAQVSLRTGQDENTDFQTVFYKRTGYGDILIEPGFSYSRRIGKDYKFNVGGVWALGSNINAKRFESVNVELKSNPDVRIDSDTLKNDVRGSVKLPSRQTFGISIEQDYKWAFGIDVSTQNWGDYQDFEARQNYGRTWIIGVGGQWIPDFFTVSKGFWRRSIFRAGVQYEQTPLVFEGQKINDYSLRLGTSVPFGRGGGVLNLTLIGGRKGTLDKNLVRETYFRAHIGITINDRWFLKPKYD
jgi:hypothetical protein